MSDSATPRTAAYQASLSFTITWSLLKLMFIESVMPSNHLILLSHPSPYALKLFLKLHFSRCSIRVFSSELALHIRWLEYWSFSVSPTKEYSGLISLQSKGLSRVFSNTTVQNHQFWYIHFPYCHFTSMNLISHISKIRGLCYRAIMRIRGIHFLS